MVKGSASGVAQSATAPRLAASIPQFIVGHAYSRRDDIHLNYGGSWQNGISSSSVCPAIFLFTGDSGEQYGYKDSFDEAGVFSYSGEGQTGDMEFKGGNRSVRDHAKDGRALHLFESPGKGRRHTYIGEFVLANHSSRRGPDKAGNDRNIIVFHLMRVDPQQEAPEVTVSTSKFVPPSLEEARKRALAACSGTAGPAGKVAVKTLYERSRAVRDYVLMRAKGHCESCHMEAPFIGADGQPYLEAHHTTRLSDGGIDHPRHVAALCPTCHRRIHCGEGGADVNRKIVEWLKVNETQR